MAEGNRPGSGAVPPRQLTPTTRYVWPRPRQLRVRKSFPHAGKGLGNPCRFARVKDKCPRWRASRVKDMLKRSLCGLAGVGVCCTSHRFTQSVDHLIGGDTRLAALHDDRGIVLRAVDAFGFRA